jgi:hypothetical protein
MIDNIKILDTKVLSDNWYVLKKITYEYSKKDGTKLTKAEKPTTEEMVQQFYFTTKNKKL